MKPIDDDRDNDRCPDLRLSLPAVARSAKEGSSSNRRAAQGSSASSQ
jgi:hypothetical protein